MALKQKQMFKTALDDNLLELEANPGESFLIKNIWIVSPVADYVTALIDRTSVGYFRCGGALGSHLNMHRGRAQHSHSMELAAGAAITATNHQQIKDAGGSNSGLYLTTHDTVDGDGTRILDPARSGDQTHKTLLWYLMEKGIFAGFPVAEGQTFALSGVKQANCIQMIEYEVHDGGDMTADMPNGSAAAEYLFINYGNAGGSIQATESNLLNTSKNPAEFPDFPFGNVVPAKQEVDIIGILGSTFAPKENDGSIYTYTKYLKLIKDREVLFDEDRNGLLFLARNTSSKGTMDMIAEGWSVIGNYTDEDAKEPFILPEPLTFLPGDELGIYVVVTVGSTGKAITIIEHEIALIERVRRAE